MDLESLRRLIHSRWDWNRERYPNLKEVGIMAKAGHVQTHLASALGKLAGHIGRNQHGLSPEPALMRRIMLALCANLLLDTLELVNVFELNTEDLVHEIERIQAERWRSNSST